MIRRTRTHYVATVRVPRARTLLYRALTLLARIERAVRRKRQEDRIAAAAVRAHRQVQRGPRHTITVRL